MIILRDIVTARAKKTEYDAGPKTLTVDIRGSLLRLFVLSLVATSQFSYDA